MGNQNQVLNFDNGTYKGDVVDGKKHEKEYILLIVEINMKEIIKMM